jgi:uncharacterized membrane protein
VGVLPAVLLCLLTGWTIVRLAWPRDNSSPEQLLLTSSLSVGCGLGIFSLIYFWVLLFSLSRIVLFAADVAVALATLLLLRRGRRFSISADAVRPYTAVSPLTRFLSGALVIACLLSLYGLVQRLLANPNGEGWDAFAIWNLHARFFFLGGEHWKEGFTNLIPWSHPDYPLLLPASIAHFWTYLGHDSVAVPAAIGLAFTLGTLGILVGGLAEFRGRNQACLGGIVLLGTPFFLVHGVSQYADVTLAYFFLAAILLVWFQQKRPYAGFLLLTGLMAGFAAWTKNEGQLFACVFLLSLAGVRWRDKGLRICAREVGLVIAGMIPVIVAVACFKIYIAPSGDLFAGNSMLLKAADWHRYWMIFRWYFKEFFVFGDWFLIPGTILILAFGWLIGSHRGPEQGSAATISAMTLALTATGYFAIFVITPNDLRWHLWSSLNRLFLQLWPSGLFLFFMLVRTPDEAVSALSLPPSTAE